MSGTREQEGVCRLSEVYHRAQRGEMQEADALVWLVCVLELVEREAPRLLEKTVDPKLVEKTGVVIPDFGESAADER
jgi:hypothetical protein